MTAKLASLPPAQAAGRLKAGRAVRIDIREADAFVRRHAA